MDDQKKTIQRRRESARLVRAEIVVKLVESRFGEVGHDRIDDVLNMDTSALGAIEERIPVANDVEELFD